ncbi:CBS domain-containing protein [Daejeonella oryzae]|uniref:CBS domain-containing protein n=1 Tax=Daejeonella oryzae TaxID=1122943 RepID=UPI00042309E8|nr:CBS domain-containing protein [Daejeonella oryzae]
MKSVKNLLNTKSGLIFSVNGNTSVFESLELMMEKNISALLIIENDKLEGIFTERDYARKIILKGKTSRETEIKEIMSSDIITITPDDTIDHCMKVMTEKHIRHLPVLQNDKVIGMVSIGDLVRFVIEDQKKTIEQLEKYINS